MSKATAFSGATRTSMVSTRVVQIMMDTVAEAGVERSEFLRAAKLEAASVLAADARLPRAKLYDLCEIALDLTNDPAFGLHSSERLANDALNPIAALVAHSATLREGMGSIDEFRRLLGEEASFGLYEQGDKVIVRCDGLPDEALRVRRFMAEVVVAGLFRTLRRFRADAHIDYVSFEYSAPEYHREYARFFEGCARFEQPFTGLCFDAKLMAAAAPHPDAELHQALRVFAARRISHLVDKAPYAARVLDLLVWRRPPRDMTMQAVARELHVSVRTLRRQLTAEGKTYAELLTEALTLIAKSSLLDERRTILETALELGFADNTTFHRAFKRWTGLTPAEYRRQQVPRVPTANDACSVRNVPSERDVAL